MIFDTVLQFVLLFSGLLVMLAAALYAVGRILYKNEDK